MEFNHIPVLVHECIDGLNIKGGGRYLDGTLGGGGHSIEIVRRLTTGRLTACDRDIEAINASKKRLTDYAEKITFIHCNFKDIPEITDESYDGILLDLGISSYQIDNDERGFSYINDAPLDMRMDRSDARTARDVVNTYTLRELTEIIRNYGEDNFAYKIASAIIRAREYKAIESTLELARIIEESIPMKFRWLKGHPAKRTFQAIRIEVNEELNGLYEGIIKLFQRINKGGRMCIISFHSLEDRIVKNAFRYLETDCICDRKAPVCTCGKIKEGQILTKKPIVPSESELEINSRAASAKLRVINKL